MSLMTLNKSIVNKITAMYEDNEESIKEKIPSRLENILS